MRFGTTFDFDRKYLKNRSWYQQRDTNFIESDLFCVGEKICEFLFTNKKVIDADVDLFKFKIRRDFGQLQTLTANMSGRIDLLKIDNLIDCHPSRVETKK